VQISQVLSQNSVVVGMHILLIDLATFTLELIFGVVFAHYILAVEVAHEALLFIRGRSMARHVGQL